MTGIIAAAGAYTFSRFVDQALADSLGLRTLRYGTQPINWVFSHLRGLLSPIYVGNTSEEYGIDFAEIFKVIDHHLTIQIGALNPGIIQQAARTFQRWILHNQIISLAQNQIRTWSPLLHDFLFKSTPLMWIFRKSVMYTVSYLQKTTATYHLIKGPEGSGNVRFVASLSFSLIAALFIPTLKLRYREAEVNTNFEKRGLGNVVLFAQKHISASHIGLVGTLTNGIGFHFPLWSHPTKVLTGMSKLAVAGVVAYGALTLCPKLILAHRTALIAGAALALL